MSPIFILCLVFGLSAAQEAAKEGAKKEDLPPIAVRAPSTFVNCECQCDPHVFQHQGRNVGNCLRYSFDTPLKVALHFFDLFDDLNLEI